MRFHFFGGKGGVGKTTCAASWAVEAAARGRTLLVTTDPASSLPDVLAATVGAEPAPVHGIRSLHAASIDAASAFQRWLTPRREVLETIALRGTYLDAEDVGRLLALSLPGIDEIIGLIEVVGLAQRERDPFDTVVVDTAPTGHTLRLLAAPDLVSRVAGVLNLLQAHHRTIVGALRGSYAEDAADALIFGLDRQADELAALLRDPETSRMVWVTLPEPMALEETADALGWLGHAGIPLDRLIVNRVTEPPPQACRWCEARRRFEARAVAPLARRFPGMPITAVPDLAFEPVGAAALRRMRGRWRDWRGPARSAPVARRVRASIAAGPGEAADIAGDAKWLLFGGKGGVGKTTCAAAAAVDLAQSRRVLLMSTDPAHSLGDVFGTPLGDQPRAVPGAPESLRAREIDAAAQMAQFRARYVDGVDAAFAGLARAGDDRTAFRDLIDLAPPGIDEVIAIAEVADTLAGGEAVDLVITDTAPTGHALRLLQTPGLLREWTQALMQILLKYREIVHASDLAALLVQTSKRLRALQERLTEPGHTRFVIVTRPEPLPRREAAALDASLAQLGIAVTAVIVNTRGTGACRRCLDRRRRQDREVKAIVHGGRGRYAIIEAPAEMPAPHGASALAAWRATWHRIA